MAELILNQTKDSVYIRFTNGKESLTYESVPEIITAIHDCYVKGKITEEEEYCFIETLLFSKNNLRDRFSFELSGDRGLFKLIDSILKNNTPLLERPLLKMCEFSQKPDHAYLTSKNGFCSNPLFSKSDCFFLILDLYKDGLITDNDFDYLNSLVEIIPLVKDVTLN
jgi:hypothetical protein